MEVDLDQPAVVGAEKPLVGDIKVHAGRIVAGRRQCQALDINPNIAGGVAIAGEKSDVIQDRATVVDDLDIVIVASDKEHVIERWTRQGDVLTVETTVEDPVMFTKPWVLAPRTVHIAAPGDYLVNYFCDGSAVAALLKSHYIKPDPNDRDIKYLCSGHRCDPPATPAEAPVKAAPKS